MQNHHFLACPQRLAALHFADMPSAAHWISWTRASRELLLASFFYVSTTNAQPVAAPSTPDPTLPLEGSAGEEPATGDSPPVLETKPSPPVASPENEAPEPDESKVESPQAEDHQPAAPEVEAPTKPVLDQQTPPPTLVTRPEPPPSAPAERRPAYVSPPTHAPPPLQSPMRRGDRQDIMPGNAPARPLTLPQGTLLFEFSHAGVLVDDDGKANNTRSPYFALGLTSNVELGVGAPLRYEQGVDGWTMLDPLVHLAVTLHDTEEFEIGARAAVLLPASTDAPTHTNLAVPLRWHLSTKFRFDFGLEGQLAFDEQLQSTLRIPVGVIVQANDWFYSGLEVAADLGLTNERDSGVDAKYTAGFTVQSKDRAHMDAILGLFVENMGGGSEGHFSNGGGLTLALRFFPDLY